MTRALSTDARSDALRRIEKAPERSEIAARRIDVNLTEAYGTGSPVCALSTTPWIAGER